MLFPYANVSRIWPGHNKLTAVTSSDNLVHKHLLKFFMTTGLLVTTIPSYNPLWGTPNSLRCTTIGVTLYVFFWLTIHTVLLTESTQHGVHNPFSNSAFLFIS